MKKIHRLRIRLSMGEVRRFNDMLKLLDLRAKGEYVYDSPGGLISGVITFVDTHLSAKRMCALMREHGIVDARIEADLTDGLVCLFREDVHEME